jgi:hypothetical protein
VHDRHEVFDHLTFRLQCSLHHQFAAVIRAQTREPGESKPR